MLLLQILLNSAVISIQTLLIGAGLYLIYNVAGIFAVHLGAAMMASAYTYFTVVIEWGLSPTIGWLAGLGMASVIMFLSYFLLRSTLRNGDRSLALLISIAFFTGFEALLGLIYGSAPQFLYPGILPVYEWAGLQINLAGVLIIAVGALATLVAGFLLFYTPVGRKMRAVKQHRISGEAMGINVTRIQVLAFVAAGLLVGINGILATINDVAEPSYATSHMLIALVAYFVGGLHSFRGLVLTTFFLVLSVELITSTTVLGHSIASTWSTAIVFLIALVVLLIRPQGIFTLNLRAN